MADIMIKVMLVDDEIMALKNIINLLDWEKAGYKIVAYETNPRKALVSLKKFRPNIIFVDIQMPVMNGLDLSREIIDSGIPVKVIILTSYKDFNYAKTSIQIGISNYLVKHELTGANLLEELEKLKNELVEDERKEGIIRQRMLRSVLEGSVLPDGSDKAVKNRYVEYKIGSLLLIFCRLDQAYNISETQVEEKIYDSLNICDIIDRIGIYPHSDLICLTKRSAAIVIYLQEHEDKSILERIVNNTFNNINSELETGETVSICYFEKKNNADDIVGIYETAKALFEYGIFLGRKAVINPKEYLAKEKISYENLMEKLDAVDNRVMDLDKEGVISCLADVFDVLRRKPWVPSILHKVCENLSGSIIKAEKEYNILTKYDSENIYDINDIFDWFNNRFDLVIEEAKKSQLKKYSKKVQYTLSFIHNHFKEDWAIEDIADNLKISEVYLRKIFKSETGETIVQYLTEFRMKKAMDLLADGKYKIFEVASMVGYNSSQYFSKVFKKYSGKNPLDYVAGE